MKAKRYFLASAVIAVILYVPLLGDVRVLKSGERQQIARPWGVLADLDTIDSFDITVLCPDPNEDAEFWKGLYDKVLTAFPENLRMRPSFRSSLGSSYRIRIEILGFEGSPNYTARVQSSLTSQVSINKGLTHANVWSAEPAAKIVQKQDLHEVISAMALEQVEEFISDYQKANPPAKRSSDINVTGVTAKEQVKPTDKEVPVEYKYVASKNSKVFHLPDCTSAKRIKPENLITYNNRAEAVNAGKRPCKTCKP